MAEPLHEHLSGEGAGKKNGWVLLTSDMQAAFEMLKKVCLEAPVLAFADFDKPFLLETDTRKSGLGVVVLQKQPDGQYYPVAYLSQSLTTHGHNYHSTKQEFLVLKWAIAEQFQEYLCCKLFVVKTNNNSLTYSLTTPNLDATWHHWVESLAGFMFSIEYQKGRDNAVADALRHFTSKLDAEVVKSILDGVTTGTIGRADAHDQVVAEADEEIHKQVEETAVQVRATHTHVNLNVTDWVAAQQEDSILKIVMELISTQKVQDLKHLLGYHATTEEGMAILGEWKKNSCSTKVPSITTTLWLEGWKKWCSS